MFDPIGNIKDISAYHTKVLANDANERAKELYPMTTARAVKSMEGLLRKNRTLNSYPINSDMQAKNGRVSEIPPTKYEQGMKNLAFVQCKLFKANG